MPRRITFAFLFLAVGVLIGISLRPNVAAGQPKEEKKEKPIPIEEVWRRGVLGQIGHPLGTIVTVEGEAADENYRRMKADSGYTLLRIKSVNDVKLKDEVVFRFDGKKADAPKVGAKFKYIGYEKAGYSGIVEGEFKYTEPYTSYGFGFHSSFVTLKDELKAK